MTELKIKQADINNNGNQRLMGEIGEEGWNSKDVSRSAVGVYACVMGEEGRVNLLFFIYLFFISGNVKYETWM